MPTITPKASQVFSHYPQGVPVYRAAKAELQQIVQLETFNRLIERLNQTANDYFWSPEHTATNLHHHSQLLAQIDREDISDDAKHTWAMALLFLHGAQWEVRERIIGSDSDPSIKSSDWRPFLAMICEEIFARYNPNFPRLDFKVLDPNDFEISPQKTA